MSRSITILCAAALSWGCEEGAPPASDPSVVPAGEGEGEGEGEGGGEEVCDPGRVTLRRLNRTEYDNTMRDLLGDETRPAREFPDDDIGYGFDNIGDVLSISPLHFERYEAAAEQLVDAALRQAEPATTRTFEAEEVGADVGAAYRESGWNIWSNGELVVDVVLPDDATYIVRVGAFGQQAGPDPVRMVVSMDRVEIARHDVLAEGPQPEIYETRVQTTAGGHSFSVAFINDFYQPDDPDPRNRDRNLILDYLEIDGPHDARVAGSEVRDRIMVCEPEDDRDVGCAARVVDGFARRAWRRPLSGDELRGLVDLVRLAVEEGDDIVTGIKLALRASLLSPHFLFKVELDADPGSVEPHRLTDHELATRMSYFLWATTPDDALAAAADAGALGTDEGVRAEVRRMLADPRSSALVDHFAGQWLFVRALDDHFPDYNYFPDFDDELRASMKQETLLFFREFLRSDRPLTEMMTADFAFIDERLALHYELDLDGEAVDGAPGFQRVDVTGTARGGLLGLGSVLTVTSFPTRTSPVRRGKWVLEQLMCAPPPPPPAGVEGELDDVDPNASLRERLAQHRADPTCATCHDQMDPIGLGMEAFDGIGAFRTMHGGRPVDASGRLPDGQAFVGTRALAAALATDRRFTDCFAQKMFVYALGRGNEPADHCELRRLRAAFGEADHRVSDLVASMATSRSFTHRRGEPPEVVDEGGSE